MLKEAPPKIDIVTKRTSLIFGDLTKEILGRGNYLRFKARGNSMFPFVRNGDIIVIKPENAGGVKVGDIILYRYPPGTYIVHRFIKKNGLATLLTRGDNLFGYDRPIPDECVLGKVTQIERDGKQIKLTTGLGKTFGLLIAWFTRGHYPNQHRMIRNLGRLYWLIGRRRTM